LYLVAKVGLHKTAGHFVPSHPL